MSRGLGKGLDALISTPETNESSVQEIKINDIEPNSTQPRKSFDQEKLNQMADSIQEHGIIQPIVVNKKGEKHEIIAGERRWRAARMAGLKQIPAIIKELSERQVMEAALIENLQREDLNPIEEATGYETLIKEYEITQDELSKIIGKSRSSITNIMRLLNLDERVKQMIINDKISSGHARTLVTLEQKDLQYKIAQKIIEKNLSVRETEKLIKSMNNKKTTKKEKKDPVFIELEESLKKVLGTKVKISSGKNKGKIEIQYYSNDDLERIINMLKG